MMKRWSTHHAPPITTYPLFCHTTPQVDGNQEALNKILYNMGASLTGAGQLREAKDCYEQVVDLDPDSEEANAALVTTLYNIGVELLNQGDCEEACDWFEQVIERDPSHVDAQEGLVIAQYNLGVELLNHDQASEAVERFASTHEVLKTLSPLFSIAPMLKSLTATMWNT